MYLDPDGRGVVYAPWVYGLEPDPVDGPSPSVPAGAVRVEPYSGAREDLRPLFELAEDSAAQLDSYLGSGRVLVARSGDAVVGHLQLVETDRSGEIELKNMAVREDLQGRGIGGRLVRAAIELVAGEAVRRCSWLPLPLTSATSGSTNGRASGCGRSNGTPSPQETGYPAGIVIDGIALRDRVWLDYPLAQ